MSEIKVPVIKEDCYKYCVEDCMYAGDLDQCKEICLINCAEGL